MIPGCSAGVMLERLSQPEFDDLVWAIHLDQVRDCKTVHNNPHLLTLFVQHRGTLVLAPTARLALDDIKVNRRRTAY